MKAKLQCKLTGAERQSSHKYIAKKAEQNNTSVEDYVDHYVTKSAYGDLKQTLAANPIKVVLNDLSMDGQTVEKILKYNGKSQKTLDDFKGNKSPEQPTETKQEEQTPELTVA